MTPKQVLYNKYKQELTTKGIEFKSNDRTFIVNVYLKSGAITVYTSQDRWENKREGLMGRGIDSLIDHILKHEVINKDVYKIISIYEKQNFIMRFLTKSFYKELTK